MLMWNSFIANGIVDTEHLDELNDEFNREYGDLVKLIDDNVKESWSDKVAEMKQKSLGVEVSIGTWNTC